MRKKFALLTLFAWREEGRWAGECIELGTATDGDSPEQVFSELSDMVKLMVEVLEEDGMLEQVFGERGVKIYSDELPARFQPPEVPWRDESRISFEEHQLPALA